MRIKEIINYVIIFASITLLGCEKDLYENLNQEAKLPFERKFLNADQLPADFRNYIIGNSSSTTARSSNDLNDFGDAIFTTYDIISITDDKKITNYSIGFLYEDTPRNVFYNLIINVSPTGQSTKYIFKYICNPADFENFKSHNFDFKYFVGVTEVSNVNDKSGNKLTSKLNSGDNDCPKVYIPSSPNQGSNPGSVGGGGSTGNESSSGGFNTSVPGYNAPGHAGGGSLGVSIGGSDGHDHSDCYGSNGDFWHRGEDLKPPHKHPKKMSSDCPEVVPPDGYVPVNTTATILADLKTWITLDRFQTLFLSINPDVLNSVYKYLNDSGASAEDRKFAVTMVNAARIEKQIDDTELDACTKAVLEKLKTLKQNDIANMFEKFGVPVNGNYNLKIVIGTPDKSNAIADTRSISKNNYLITIRESYLKGTDNNLRSPTDLAIAAIVIHEIIHAHFFALYDDFRYNGNVCAYDNYDCLFMKYVSNNFEETTDPQHAQMFENYLDVMANALQEFQTGIPVPNAERASLFYHDLALSTLGDTQIFKDRYPLGYNVPTYEERRRIVNNRTAEEKNITIDDAENGKYIPKGKPCN